MKVLIALCVVALAAVTLSFGKPQDCVYVMGQCSEYCPEGTHSYTTGCGPLTPEATCDNPNPVPEEGDVCDYSNCYCNAPTVRDSVSGKCVKLAECPKKEETENKNVTTSLTR